MEIPFSPRLLTPPEDVKMAGQEDPGHGNFLGLGLMASSWELGVSIRCAPVGICLEGTWHRHFSAAFRDVTLDLRQQQINPPTILLDPVQDTAALAMSLISGTARQSLLWPLLHRFFFSPEVSSSHGNTKSPPQHRWLCLREL